MERLRDYKKGVALLADMPTDRLAAISVFDYSHIDSGLVDSDLFPLSIVGVDQLTSWEDLSDNEYNVKRNAWFAAIIKRLDQEWPRVCSAVVRRDLAIARTMHECLNTPGGALYGFAPNVLEKMPLTGPSKSPKNSIKKLWLASAFAGFGGFSGAMGAGGATAKSSLRVFM